MEIILNKVSSIVRETVSKEAPIADKEGRWVKDTMLALKESGLTGLVVPKDSGGQGLGLEAIVKVSEELGKAYSSAGLCFGMHCVGTAVIAAKATPWHKKNYLEPIAHGEHITTLALSEPGTGAHFYFPQTSLIQQGKDIMIDGAKTFVTNGGHADSYVISTLGAGDNATPGQFSCVILDKDTPGMSWGGQWDGLGMRGNSSRGLKLANVSVSGDHVLGEPGDQLWYVFNIVAPYFLMAMAGTYLGVAAAAFEEAKKSVLERSYSHNGSNLSHHSIIQHKIGNMWQRLESTRALIYSAAYLGDRNDPAALAQVLASKVAAANCAVDLANEAMTLAGGIGYQSNSNLAMILRDARAAHVMSPTTDILQTWIGRTILGLPILSD